jgi:citronellol/citronellal dehydrogenase
MSLCVLGMAGEFRDAGIAVNALWPRTGIATAAVKMLGGQEGLRHCRTPEIMADAAYWILTQPSRECTGNYFIDDEVMIGQGVTDLSKYAIDPKAELMPDFFVEPAGK